MIVLSQQQELVAQGIASSGKGGHPVVRIVLAGINLPHLGAFGGDSHVGMVPRGLDSSLLLLRFYLLFSLRSSFFLLDILISLLLIAAKLIQIRITRHDGFGAHSHLLRGASTADQLPAHAQQLVEDNQAAGGHVRRSIECQLEQALHERLSPRHMVVDVDGPVDDVQQVGRRLAAHIDEVQVQQLHIQRVVESIRLLGLDRHQLQEQSQRLDTHSNVGQVDQPVDGVLHLLGEQLPIAVLGRLGLHNGLLQAPQDGLHGAIVHGALLDQHLKQGKADVDQLGADLGPARGCNAGEEAQGKVLRPLRYVVTEQKLLRL